MKSGTQVKSIIRKHVFEDFLRKVDSQLTHPEEVYITGGAALSFYDIRSTFSDVDFFQSVSPNLERAMQSVNPGLTKLCNADAATLAWDYDYVDWQNGVSEQLGLKNIRVKVPPLEFLLVSKCCSMRFDPSNENSDDKDVWKIVEKLGIQTIDEIEHYVHQYGLEHRFSDRSKAITKDIIEAIQKHDSYNPLIAR